MSEIADIIKKIYEDEIKTTEKGKKISVVYISLGIMVVFAFIYGAIHFWNKFNAIDMPIIEARYQIDKEILRKKNLIPNLIQAVINYAGYENVVMSKTVDTRTSAGVSSVKPLEGVMNELSKTDINQIMPKLIAVAEQYPDLKANIVFQELMKNLVDAENRIAAWQEEYNKRVCKFNNYLGGFPHLIYANLFFWKYKPFPFYDCNKKMENIPQVNELNLNKKMME